MHKKQHKRITIYDIARELNIAPSSVSKALNDQPTVSKKTKELVKAKAGELNYKHNLQAANLRMGMSRAIGVVVPKINTSFFSGAIAGMEELCFEHGHQLIICQSEESYVKEIQAVETLVRNSVDCIIISLSAETKNTDHIRSIANQHVHLIQFDRVDASINSFRIVNDNKVAAYKAVKHLIGQGYQRIALLGGVDQLLVYKERKDGYLQAVQEAGMVIPYNYVVNDVLTTDKGMEVAIRLLKGKMAPDAFFVTSDYAALGILRAASELGLSVPQQIGIMGFANEPFTELVSPSISSVDQKSRLLGREAIDIYFRHVLKRKTTHAYKEVVIPCEVIVRDSSLKHTVLTS